MIQSTQNGFEIAEEEMNRVYAETAQGEQSIAVQRDMKAWAVKKGIWLSEHYKNIIFLHDGTLDSARTLNSARTS